MSTGTGANHARMRTKLKSRDCQLAVGPEITSATFVRDQFACEFEEVASVFVQMKKKQRLKHFLQLVSLHGSAATCWAACADSPNAS